MLHSICQKIWKTQQWPQDWKRSVFIPIPKGGQRVFKLLHYCTHFTCKQSNAQNSLSQASTVCKPRTKNEDNGTWSHHFMANRWGNNANRNRLYFLGLQNHCRWWLQPWNQKMLAPWKKSYDKPRQHIKKQRHYVFPIVLYRCESWTVKKAKRRRIDAFELWG